MADNSKGPEETHRIRWDGPQFELREIPSEIRSVVWPTVLPCYLRANRIPCAIAAVALLNDSSTQTRRPGWFDAHLTQM